MVLQAIKYTPATDDRSSSLEILDQLVLPHSSTYIPVTSCEDGFKAIKQMNVRGAPAIAIVAALALAVELRNAKLGSDSAEGVEKTIFERLDFLKASRPTAVNLGDAVVKLKRVVEKATSGSRGDAAQVVNAYVAAAERMLIDDVSDNRAIGQHGADWILKHARSRNNFADSGQVKILTHCNTGSLATAGYGTALGVIRSLNERGNLERAYCSETRPYNQGSRLTAYELVHDEIPATLITDSMAASLLAQEHRLTAIIVGADRVAANGDTANKIGTYSLAVLARYHDVKFLVAAPRTTIDRDTPSGKDIEIEQRAASEVTRIRGPQLINGELSNPATISVAANGIDIWNPAFDITPAELIDGVITELGVVEKKHGARVFDFEAVFATSSGAVDNIKPSTVGDM